MWPFRLALLGSPHPSPKEDNHLNKQKHPAPIWTKLYGDPQGVIQFRQRSVKNLTKPVRFEYPKDHEWHEPACWSQWEWYWKSRLTFEIGTIPFYRIENHKVRWKCLIVNRKLIFFAGELCRMSPVPTEERFESSWPYNSTGPPAARSSPTCSLMAR